MTEGTCALTVQLDVVVLHYFAVASVIILADSAVSVGKYVVIVFENNFQSKK